MSWQTPQTVLVPVDFSAASADAIQAALKLVSQPPDVHVLHVTMPPPPMLLAYGDVWVAQDSPQRQQVAVEHLSRFLCERGFAGVTQIVREGDPGLTIVDYAHECHADLIVIPSHGRHGLKRLLLGSVAERVLRHAGVPVLVLPRKE